jgi:hypothetical protein
MTMCAYQRKWDQTSRDDWERRRLAQDVARGNVKRTAEIDAFLGGASKAEAKKQRPQQPADPFKQLNRDLRKLDKQISDNMKQSEAGRHKQKPKSVRGGYLVAMQDSTCFSDLVYSSKDGGVFASFIGPGAGDYFYPMSRADAKAWFDDSSLGAFFNAFVRDAE